MDSNSILSAVVGGESDNSGTGVPRDEAVASPAVETVVYLAHPYLMKEEIAAVFQPKLEAAGLSVINPFQRPEQEGYEKAMTETGLTAKMCDEIVAMDLEKIDKADGVVAVLDGVNSPGTIMEIFYAAYTKGKPVFAYTLTERNRKHPWIRSLCVVSPTENALMANLRGWINVRNQH